MNKIKINLNQKMHFIGIGGIGMSGSAQIMKNMGFKVQGSDMINSKNVERCRKIGIKIFRSHKKENIDHTSIVIKSSAIKNSNPEIKAAIEKNITILKRAEMLAHVVALKTNIVITGSHGKTTTTSLISNILSQAKFDPTIINGGIINSFNGNARLGKGNWAVLEADESDGSFLNFPINYSVVTNIDREHMDFYKSLDNLKKYFNEFIEKVPSFGKSFICLDDKINSELVRKLNNRNFYTYGTNSKSNFLIKNIKQNIKFTQFDLEIKVPNKKKLFIKKIKIPLLGVHNVRNSVAALAVALTVGISVSDIKKRLFNFEGVQRRFNKIFSYNDIDFYDDYAHHPTEIKFVLEGVKQVYSGFEKVCIFQPHRISRLKDLRKEFSFAFQNADTVVLCPVYTAGEKIKLGFSYLNFAKEIIKNSKVKLFLINDFKQLAIFLKKNMYGKKIIIGMGAGSISNWMRSLQEIIL